MAFMDKIFPVTESGCWIWMGYLNNWGYGKVGTSKGPIYAHRKSWTMHKGEIPSGMLVLHKCDVRCCVNPDHLFIGTASENMFDMWKKGRHQPVGLVGECHPRAKLTLSQVLEIKNSKIYTKGLSEKFGVTSSRISAIRNGISWSHVK